MLFDHSLSYSSYVPVDSSFDVMGYDATTYDRLFNMASTTTINGLNFQTTYDMANDITIFSFHFTPRIFY